MIIKNHGDLGTTPARRQALDIVESGIQRVLPGTIMTAALRYEPSRDSVEVMGRAVDLSKGRVFVVGGGKAAAAMTRLLEDIIGSRRISAGLVTTKYGESAFDLGTIEVIPAGHPVPDRQGVDAVRRMLDLKSRFSIGRDDTVICLLSGGGSALLPCPVDDITLGEKQAVTGLLLASGANITEINCVRKHLSKTKGGQLGRHFAPATVISLILSDVVGNDLGVIASGPTYPDLSTFSEALAVLRKYDIDGSCPAGVLHYLERGHSGVVPETPKSLDNCRNFIIGDLRLALDAMRAKASALGLRPLLVTGEQTGETGAAAWLRAGEIVGQEYQWFQRDIGGWRNDATAAGRSRHGREEPALRGRIAIGHERLPWTMGPGQRWHGRL